MQPSYIEDDTKRHFTKENYWNSKFEIRLGDKNAHIKNLDNNQV